MNFYIASSFANIPDVRYMSTKLKQAGLKHSYDWTLNNRADTIEKLISIGQAEKKAVEDSDFFILLLPAGPGSHIELGMALSLDKQIFICAPSASYFQFEKTTTFYHLPCLCLLDGDIAFLTESILNRLATKADSD
ncbi:group-specific protein [Bacillus sp. 1P06AnD]|uniref:group-specific protein n=1 Tax=Bacillus sp. 1P06AnD TaxID=3132208 RepID=UPI00399F7BB7